MAQSHLITVNPCKVKFLQETIFPSSLSGGILSFLSIPSGADSEVLMGGTNQSLLAFTRERTYGHLPVAGRTSLFAPLEMLLGNPPLDLISGRSDIPRMSCPIVVDEFARVVKSLKSMSSKEISLGLNEVGRQGGRSVTIIEGKC